MTFYICKFSVQTQELLHNLYQEIMWVVVRIGTLKKEWTLYQIVEEAGGCDDWSYWDLEPAWKQSFRVGLWESL